MNYRQQALNLARRLGIARARDFTTVGIPLVYLKRLTDSGDLVRLGRGLYQESARAGEHIAHNLAEAARRVPHGVVSLLSALRFHGLTTQLPSAVWMTIPHKARTPNVRDLPLEIVRATGLVLTAGVERVVIEGVDVPIYGVAKTIADCYKHRRHVGEDVAVEALRDALEQGKTTAEAIREFAVINRVSARIEEHLKERRR